MTDDRDQPEGFDHVSNLALPGGNQPSEILSVMFDAGCPSSLATVYASVFGRDPFARVRLNLVAHARGHRGILASAFVPPGWDGPVIAVTGVCVESWHVEAQGAQDAVLSASLAARRCCSGFGVHVPPELLMVDQLPQDLLSGLRVPPMPWTPDRGAYSVKAGAAPATENIEARTRVLRIWAHASGAGGSIAATIGVVSFTLPVPATAEGSQVLPRGNLVGPGSITFANVDAYVVELVR